MEKQRIEKWDNLKFLLIFLVVLGHLCDKYKGSSAMQSMYFFIYIFHMPLFIFVSGLFSKKNIEKNRFDKIFSYLALFYFIKIVIWCSDALVSHKFNFSVFPGRGIAWFAFALFAFNLLTIAVKSFNHKYVFVFSIVLACLAGYDNNISDFFALSRIIVYFPFFYAGYCLESDKVLSVLAGKWKKVLAWILLIALVFFVFWKIDTIYELRPLLTGRNPFKTLGDFSQYGIVIRFLYYIAVFIVGAAVITIVPNKLGKGRISILGSRSVQVYTLHYIFLKILYTAFPIEQWWVKHLPGHSYMIVIPLALVITLICSWKGFEKVFHIILSPKSVHKTAQ